MNPRWLVLHLPAFRLERCGYGASALVVLVAPERGAERVVGLTPGAVVAGVRRGMTADSARALVPELEVLPWDEAGEQVDRAELLRALEVVSDRVSAPWEDTFLAEISHTPRPEAVSAQEAVRYARSLGHSARAAVADDPLAARAVAVWIAEDEGSVVVAAGEAARVLAPLPITSLDPGQEVASAKAQLDLFEALRAVGVETVGQWAALEPSAVAGRYGPLAARLHQVARGGRAGLLGHWTRAGTDELPSVKIPMAGATTRQELLFVLPGAAAELSDALAEQDLAAVRLRLVLALEGTSSGLSTVSTTVRLGRPSRSARKLERLAAERLERLALESELVGDGGASAVEFGLEVLEAAPERGWQPGLTDRAEASEAVPDLVARLADQLGDQAVFAPVLEPVWRPERAWRKERFPRAPSLGGRPRDPRDPVEILERWEPSLPLPRPAILLAHPQSIEVSCESSRPVRVRTHPHGWRPISRSAGPERLCGEWWTRKPLDREYWVVEVDGRTWWIYREPNDHWWAHGYFD